MGRLLVLIAAVFFTGNAGVYAQKTENAATSEYQQTIQKADAALIDKDYINAIHYYEKAWNLFQRQKYPERKILQIVHSLSGSDEGKALVNALINNGDSCMQAGDYKSANIALYDALKIDPESAVASQKLQQIAAVYSDNENETRFRIVLIHASKYYERGRYIKSLIYYRQAQLMKPGEIWLNSRIREVESMEKAHLDAMDNFSKIIDRADNLLEAKQWREARNLYQQAASLKPRENYPQARMVLIDHILAHLQNIKPGYEAYIAEADKFYKLRDYENAYILYRQAADANPEKDYPLSMLKKLDPGKSSANVAGERYEAAVANADLLAMAGDVEAALTGFEWCKSQYPDDVYVLSRIKELTAASKEANPEKNAYQTAVDNGSKSFASGNYRKALMEFRYASTLRPDLQLPKDKIAEIQKLMQRDDLAAKQKAMVKQSGISERENESVALIEPQTSEASTPEVLPQSTAENATAETVDLKTKQKPVGVESVPLVIKPDETNADKVADTSHLTKNNQGITPSEPRFLHTVVEKPVNPEPLLQPEKNAKNESEASTNTTELANSTIENLSQQKEIVNETKEVSTTRTTEPSGIAANRKKNPPSAASPQRVAEYPKAANQPSNTEYERAIAFADDAFASKKYEQAKNGYTAALKILPNEVYPANQLKRIADMDKTRRSEYDALLLQADEAYTSEKLDEALRVYQNASIRIPSERYPRERIALINDRLKKQKALEDNYAQAIEFADLAFGRKNFIESMSGYQFALKLKPDEAYPKQKLNEINGILGATKAVMEDYHKAISSADRAFQQNLLQEALSGYEHALSLKPNEVYPRQKVAAIRVTLDQLQARQLKFDTLIARGDEAVISARYSDAITLFRAALDVNPGSEYPKSRIAFLNDKLRELKVLRDNYSKSIFEGDKAAAARNYDAAIAAYTKALGFMPDESYPREQITVITANLALDQQKLNQKYNEYLQQAESARISDDLMLAFTLYTRASELKPDELYPSQQAKLVADELKARSDARKQAYDNAIAQADNAYKILKFDAAMELYKKALEIRPGEVYPGQMLYRIRKYLVDNSVVTVAPEGFLLSSNTTRQFSFRPVDPRLRNHNYLVIKARSSSGETPKLYVNYGRDKSKNGGIVVKDIDQHMAGDLIIDISNQDPWFREDNNWLSLYSENGDIEISSIRISQRR